MIREGIIITAEHLDTRSSFMVQDIAGVVKELGLDVKIQELYYCYNENLKKEFDEYFELHKLENTVFCITAYVSAEEFPKEEYYLYEDDKQEGKKPLPVNEVLERDSKVLTECGFININDFVNYEYKVAFIYPNTPGLQVIEKIKELLSEDK